MPYIHVDALVTPSDDVEVWRYMNLAKLVSILQRRSLFFCRLDCLGDPHEGLPPQGHHDRFIEAVEAADGLRPELRSQLRVNLPQSSRESSAFIRQTAYTSCWHRSEYESAGMWAAYGDADCPLAIRTTIGRLKESVYDASERVYIGQVEYLDFTEVLEIPEALAHSNSFLPPLAWKRRSFEHEKEVRMLHVDFKGDHPGGLHVSVDPTALIESVLVAPVAQSWVLDVVQGITEKYGLSCPVQQSDLNADPVY